MTSDTIFLSNVTLRPRPAIPSPRRCNNEFSVNHPLMRKLVLTTPFFFAFICLEFNFSDGHAGKL